MPSDKKGFLAGLLQGRFLGHPIHVMLVHFPTAFFILATVLQCIVYFGHQMVLLPVAYYVLFCGVVSAAPTAAFGAWDLMRISPASKALKIALIHGSLQFLVVIFFLLALLSMAKHKPDFQAPSGSMLVGYVLAGLLILLNNYLGGELMIRYKVGIEDEHAPDAGGQL